MRPEGIVNLNIEAAISEVQSKTSFQIQRETAALWASRSIACRRMSSSSKNMARQVSWLLLAEDYEQEAVEHAALARDGGETLQELEVLFAAERTQR